ncbi:NUDIX domain-containing protein [Sulfidibacter corallicola]|uniref:NUDIX domain-containing protein n=1 Tax=Sulfidibacter corallicola TaxID=2818388 RepID=A0A8A4TTU9_SULCO|nr:NUDIX domain-containing protein [Sulfidibacter corallicola]QTD52538.1 NUDIX domain-containing protein [Sulfidibacter corallicola]
MRVRGAGMIIRDGKMLVLAYDYPKGRVLAIPGGGVHEGETLAESVCREFAEELGLTVRIGDLRYVGDMMAQPKIPQTVHVVFDAEIVAGEPVLNRNETSAAEVLWLDLAELGSVRLYPAINEAIQADLEKAQADTRYLGDCQRREWA